MASLTKPFLSEFITMYREESCLWRVRGAEYSNRNLRTAAVHRLVRKMREADPEATPDTVRKKINSFRTVFRKEHRKVLRSRMNGHVHRPTLWYYDLLLFLADQYDPHRSRTQPTDGGDQLSDVKIEEHSDDSSYQDEDGAMSDRPSSSSSSEMTTTATTTRTRSLEEEDDDQEVVKTKKRARRGKTLRRRHRHQDEDFFAVMAKNWGNKMRNISRENPLMAKIAEKLIGEVFFEADMGTLTKRSFVVNPGDQEYSITASSL